MNNHPTHTQILQQTTAVIFTRHRLLPFLFLSFILLGVRTKMGCTTQFITSLIDNDPSIESLFLPKPTNYRRRQFTGGDQFFKNSFTTKPQLNATPIILDSFNNQLGFFNASVSVIDGNNEIEHQDLTTALGSFFLSYGCMLLVYVVSHSYIYGIIFLFVVNDHILKNRNSFTNTYRKGVILGLNRLLGFLLLKWLLLQLLVQLLSVWFVASDDQYSHFKILVRLTFLPFSTDLNWVVKGFEKEINGFLITYFTLELLISYDFAISVWVVMADPKKTYREVIREGCHMLSLSINPAIFLKCLENAVSALLSKPVMSQLSGEFLAPFIRSFMVIYFMVAWMMYYFSLKSLDASSRGVTFAQTEFNDMLNDDS